MKVWLMVILIGLFIASAGGIACAQGDVVRGFFLVGGGATVALIGAASMGPPRPPAV